MGHVRRHTFFLCRSTIIGVAMLLIDILGFVLGKANIAIAVAVVLIMVQITFKVSLGPAGYVIVAETPSTRNGTITWRTCDGPALNGLGIEQ